MTQSDLLFVALGGVAVGIGAWLVLAVRFARPSLAERLSDPPPPRAARVATPDEGFTARLGTLGVPVLSTLGLPGPKVLRDLAVCERDAERYLAEKFTVLLLGIVAPPFIGTLMALAGVNLPPLVALGGWVLFALVLWFAPDSSLRDEANKRRKLMRHALAGFSDLVVVALAGGAGVNGALTDATATSTSWAMTRIRTALRGAALDRRPPWAALRELGDRYDVPEFAELSASLQLAGSDGARVRGSLAAKARTLRTQHLAEMDAEAQSATEKMSLPVVLLFAGFLVMLGYPALSLVMTGL
ncbi:type II secretion system F family protein [Actinorugispora endophytica]|uniref:Type II secretion system (T2SS) protein F n=1 Tax=Actinorugispora endophytica TaxID=1605990 RepID=A0A4R6V474_9ACTN|nr:type II secretion system F family protein [Actinorugispora endophytica]TDQ55101.1 type II secretion system (T2SS) protein F [Actinorugispora endophytica]